MAIFGNNTIEATEDNGGLTSSKGSRFTAPSSGTITQISVYFVDYFGGTANLRVAIYNDNAGRPGTKLAESPGATTVDHATAWFAVAISAAIISGTDYWLIGWVDSAVADPVRRIPGDTTNQSTSNSSATFPTWPTPYGEDSPIDAVYSIYADYTPSSSANKVGSMLTMFQ